MKRHGVNFLACLLAATSAAGIAGTARAEPPAPSPAPQTQPVRRMLWDRARVAVDLARREAQARKAVEDLEQRAKTDPVPADVPALLARARATLERVQKEKQDARQRVAGDVVLEKAAYLGIATSPANAVLRKHLKLPDGVGLVVDFVEPGSPAANAGVQPHDVAHRLNEQILVNPPQLAVLVRTFEPDTEVTLDVFRAGQSIAIPMRLAERDVMPLDKSKFDAALAVNNLAFTPGAPPESFVAFIADTKTVPPLKAGDLVRITVHDLGGPGAQTVVMTYVERDGHISLPQLKTPVRVSGTSGRKLVDTIRDAYRAAGVFENPRVSVQLMKPAPTAGGKKE